MVYLVTAAKLVNAEDLVQKAGDQPLIALRDPSTISKKQFREALQDSVANPIYERKRGGQDDRPEGFQNDQHALHWHSVYRDLVAHPIVAPIMQQIIGPGFRLDHINVHARPATFPGGTLHGGDNPGGGNGFFGFRNGAFQNVSAAPTQPVS